MKWRTSLITTAFILSCTAIATTAVLLLWPTGMRQEAPHTEKEEQIGEMLLPKEDKAIGTMSLAKGVKLKFTKFTPVYPDTEAYVTESPITNAQYAVAVAEQKASPPELPDELYPDKGVTEASWRDIAWTNGAFPKGKESHVVLFVNHADAEAYCRWLEGKNSKYHFRLPKSMEKVEWREEKVQLNRRTSERDSAFPRPAEGPGAERIYGRFWAAPWTDELFDIDAAFHDDAEGKKLYLLSFPQSHRYARSGAGALPGSVKVVPTTFRVVAVKKKGE